MGAAQIFSDFSIGLPPMNQALAHRLMQETKVHQLLQGYEEASADLGN
jgi:acetyltransferase